MSQRNNLHHDIVLNRWLYRRSRHNTFSNNSKITNKDLKDEGENLVPTTLSMKARIMWHNVKFEIVDSWKFEYSNYKFQFKSRNELTISTLMKLL
jgi:hypothetical protein